MTTSLLGFRVLCCPALVFMLFLLGCSNLFSGDDPTPVTDPPHYPAHHECPAWSSNGPVAYSDAGLDSLVPGGIWQVDVDSYELTHLLPSGRHADWSPDGSMLAFSAGWQIFTSRSDGSEVLQLTSGGTNLHPTWSPDGRMIAWAQTEGANGGVWVMKSDGSDQRLLIPLGSEPDWSPSGGAIVYCGHLDVEHRGIAEYDLGSGDTVFLLSHHVDEHLYSLSPTYSPAGDRLAYVESGLEMLHQLWVMDADGSNANQVTILGGSAPSWSPDGSALVYARDDPRCGDPECGVLWIVDLVSGGQHQLTFKP